jgi:hypothetical protein
LFFSFFLVFFFCIPFLNHSLFPGVALSDSVILLVYYPLVLDPAGTQYVLVGSSLQYVLQTQTKTGLVALSMPDHHYKWETSNASVVSIDERGKAVALKVGRSEVNAINMEMAGNRATGRLHVVHPAYVSLEAFLVGGADEHGVPTSESGTPSSATHNLIVGREYDVRCHLFEQGGHKLSQTAHLDWKVTLPPTWRSTRIAANLYRVVPSAAGTFVCAASLSALLNESTNKSTILSTPLRAEQEMFVTDPVKISPSFALLPVDAQAVADGQRFSVHGGSGRYNFYSSNRAVVSVDAGGAVQPRSVGLAQIAAVDQTNLQNQDRASVEVAEPVTAVLSRVQFEVRRGEEFLVPLEIRDAAGRPFTNCSSLKVQWSVEDYALVTESTTSLVVSKSSSDVWCTGKTFIAKELGRTIVRFSFGPTMSGEAIVRIYDPVAIEGPASWCASVGTSVEVGWRGGPPPGDASSFFSHLVPLKDASAVKIENVQLADGKSGFRVTCLRAHTQDLQLRVGNSPTKLNPKPAESTATVHVNCIEVPSMILLYPVPVKHSVSSETSSLAAGQAQCSRVSTFAPLDVLLADSASSNTLARYQVTNDEPIYFRVVVMDDTRLVCSNFSSIPIAFETDQGAAVSVKPDGASVGAAVLSLEGFTGNVVVTAKTGSTVAPSQVELNVVHPLRVSEREVFLFNDHTSSAQLNVTGGSGIYSFLLTPPVGEDNAVISLLSENSPPTSVRIGPVRPGVVSIAIRDVCMAGKSPAVVRVRVADLKSLTVDSRQNFVPVGGNTTVDVSAFSNFDELLNNTLVQKYVRIVPRHDDFLAVKASADGTRWIVTCLSIGTGSVLFVGTSPAGAPVQSAPVSIQCFPPLSLFPRLMRLLPNEVYQVRWSGCPSVSELSFEVADASVASVDSSGTIVAGGSPGKTVLSASCRGIDPASSDSKRVFSSDRIDLDVQRLGDLRLRCPANVLLVGAEMTVHAQGRNGETPITFGTQPLRYRWDAMNPEIASFISVFGAASGNIESSFSVRVVGKNAGTTRISAWVTKGDDSQSEVALGSCQITVTEPLTYINGCNAVMLLPPLSRGQIRTSKDATRTLSYRVFGGQHDSDIRVDDQGVVSTGSSMGSAFVEVSDLVGGGGSSSAVERLVVEVRIAPVHMLQLLPDSISLHHHHQQDGTLPIGGEVRVRVVLRATNGAPFHSAEVAFEHEMNTYDVVSIRPGSSNDTIILRAMRPGKAVVRVFATSDPTMEDFLLVTSGNAISPSQPIVALGGSLQFSAFVAASSATPVWSSLNPLIVAIDEETGKASALRVGRARIMLREGSVTTFTEVEVVKVERIVIDKLEEPLSNVVLLGSGKSATVRVRVSFMSGGNVLRRAAGVDHNILHACQIVEHTWAFAIAQYDNSTDVHYCAVTALRPRNPKNQAPKFLTLEVKVGELSESAPLPFVSGFALVSDADESIELSVDKRAHLLEILPSNSAGQDQAPPLMVSTSNPDKLEVRSLSETSSLYVFQLRVIDGNGPSFDVQLQLLSPSTGQKLTIPVSFRGPAVVSSAPLVRPSRTDGQQQQQQQQQQQTPPKVVEVVSAGKSSVLALVLLFVLFVCCLVGLVAGWRYLAEPVVPSTSASTLASAGTPVRQIGADGFTPSKSWGNRTTLANNTTVINTPNRRGDGASWISSPLSNDTTRITPSNAGSLNLSAFDATRRR